MPSLDLLKFTLTHLPVFCHLLKVTHCTGKMQAHKQCLHCVSRWPCIVCVLEILSFWLYTDFYADCEASLGTGSDRTAMSQWMLKLSKNFICYGSAEQNLFFSLRQKFGTSEHQLHLISPQSALVFIRSIPTLILFFFLLSWQWELWHI